MDTVTDATTEPCPPLHQNGTARRESPDSRPTVLRLHFYNGGHGASERGGVLGYPPGDHVAEELCIDAAEACSECAVTRGHGSSD